MLREAGACGSSDRQPAGQPCGGRAYLRLLAWLRPHDSLCSVAVPGWVRLLLGGGRPLPLHLRDRLNILRIITGELSSPAECKSEYK